MKGSDVRVRRRRTLAITVGLLNAVLGLHCASKPAGHPTSRPTLQFDHGGIIRGDVSRKTLSLVFTGGDFAEGVPTILATCAKHRVPAAFFVTGDFLRRHPDAANAIVAARQLIGPHSDQHLLYADWTDRERTLVSEAQFKEDLRRNLDALAAIGAPRSPYFLPPFEWYNGDQVRWSRDLGLTLVNFTPGSGSNRDYLPESDPKFTPSAKLVEGVLSFEAHSPHGMNGFILLMHAGSSRRDKMHDHLEPLIETLQARGYHFVPLGELLGDAR